MFTHKMESNIEESGADFKFSRFEEVLNFEGAVFHSET